MNAPSTHRNIAPADTISFRAARVADHPSVVALLRALSLPIDGVPDDLRGFHVATARDEIVGVAGLEIAGTDERAALLRSVAVRGDFRDRGIARALVDAVLADATSLGLRDIYLLTTTAADYFAARGFRVIARTDVPAPLTETAEFRGACPASATVMVAALGG